jgi:DNA invertase Pin-like site-specific DNA recombinase
MKKKAVIYTRVSTQEQHTENQLGDLLRYAEARGFEVVKVFQEKAPGMDMNRKDYKELLEIVRKRKTDIVLVWRFDRFARSTKELIERLEEFRTLGVEFISYTENIDTTSPAGRVLFTIISSFAQFENDIRSERIKAGMKRIKEQGKPIGRPGVKSHLIEAVQQLKAKGEPISGIMKQLELSRNTVKKYLKDVQQ